MTLAMLMGVCVLGCMAVVAAPLPSSDMLDPESSRAQSMRRSEARLAGTVCSLAVFSLGALYALERGSTWPIGPIAVGTLVGLVALHPWLAVRWIFIPLGLPRLAVSLGRLGGHPWIRDPEGGKVLSGVLAQLRRPVDPEMNAWLRDRLHRGPLRGAGLVAAGLLAADERDRGRARALLVSVDDLDPDLSPPLARRIALDWLVADAVRDGDWSRVLGLAEGHPSPSRTVRLMIALARVHRGESAREARLWRAWLLAPRRRRTWSAVVGATREPVPHRAPALESIAWPSSFGLAANDGGPSPRQALALHVEALVDADAPGARGRLDRLGEAWDRALDDFGFRGYVRRRAQALRCTTASEKALAQLHRDVCEDIADLLTLCGVEAGSAGDSRTVSRAGQHLHDSALRELERVAEGVDGPRPEFATVDHVLGQWLAWLRIRRRYQMIAAVASLDLRGQAYAIVELHLRQLMAWLWNDLGERGLANAISTWLLLEAERVHDEESASYHRHNVALVI